jgi:hypothetical protein
VWEKILKLKVQGHLKMLLILCAVVAIAFLVHKLVSGKNDYFERKGIIYRQPDPLWNVVPNLIMKKESLYDVVIKWYNEFRDAK